MRCPSVVRMGLLAISCGLAGAALTGCGGITAQTGQADAREAIEQPGAPPDDAAVALSKGMTAIKRAADAGKYLFVFVFDGENAKTTARRDVFEKAMAKMTGRADALAIKTPTLLIGGGATTGSLSAIWRVLAAHIEGANTAVIPNAGHWMFEQAPQKYSERDRQEHASRCGPYFRAPGAEARPNGSSAGSPGPKECRSHRTQSAGRRPRS